MLEKHVRIAIWSPRLFLALTIIFLGVASAPGLSSAQEVRGCAAEGPGATAGAAGAGAVAALPVIQVVGDVARPMTFGAAELERLPRRRALVEDRNGPAEFEGVPLLEILRAAGLPVESLRGAQVATVVIAEARDGYRAAYSLGELDDAFSGRLFILADRRGGDVLGEDEGPFRVVAEGDTRRSRWIREVRCLRVVTH
jgi:hypothetical protein